MTIVQTNVNVGLSICQPMLCGRSELMWPCYFLCKCKVLQIHCCY